MVSHDQHLIQATCREMWHVSNHTVRVSEELLTLLRDFVKVIDFPTNLFQVLPNGFPEYKKIIQTELSQRNVS